jgi:two-component system LytT family response regulator
MKALRRKITPHGGGKHIRLWPDLPEQHSSPVADASFSKVTLNVQNGVEFIDPLTVTHLKAQSNYTTIHCASGRHVMVSRTLKNCMALFPSHFIRIHQTYLVNPQHIQSYLRHNQEVRLDGGMLLPVSRSGKKVMQEFLKRC